MISSLPAHSRERFFCFVLCMASMASHLASHNVLRLRSADWKSCLNICVNV